MGQSCTKSTQTIRAELTTFTSPGNADSSNNAESTGTVRKAIINGELDRLLASLTDEEASFLMVRLQHLFLLQNLS